MSNLTGKIRKKKTDRSISNSNLASGQYQRFKNLGI